MMFLLGACRPAEDKPASVNYEKLPPTSGDLINAVVEVPAGTNHKIEYDYEQRAFLVDTIDGDPRVIDFLPYPGNYGFIPGTLMDTLQGGDGDALDILVLSETQPTGSVLAVRPLAALLLRDRGEIDTKIIGIPADSTQRIIQADNFVDFILYYDSAKRMIEDWFLSYKGPDMVELIRWEDENFARQEVERRRRKEDR